MTDSYLQVQTTTDSRENAAALARSLVEARFAACAQVVGPITSAYWWEGAVATEEEYLVLAKTTEARYAALEAHLRAVHSYDTPEIIATALAAGSRDYLTWVAQETRPAS